MSDADGHLLLRLPEGVTDIAALSLKGKVQTYAFAFDTYAACCMPRRTVLDPSTNRLT